MHFVINNAGERHGKAAEDVRAVPNDRSHFSYLCLRELPEKSLWGRGERMGSVVSLRVRLWMYLDLLLRYPTEVLTFVVTIHFPDDEPGYLLRAKRRVF